MLGQAENDWSERGAVNRTEGDERRRILAAAWKLPEDYHDFLRVRNAKKWSKDCKEALFVRKLGSREGVDYEAFREFVDTRPGEVVANIAICLIHQANFLLDQQIRRLEQDFLQEGGLRERMTRARLEVRERQQRGKGRE